jgi:glucans biosynthesis protein
LTDGFSFQTVIDRARASAARAFVKSRSTLKEPFADLTYDQFRGIRFRDEKRFWSDGMRGFQMDLLPPGFFFDEPIELNLVSGSQVQEVAFSADYFTFHPDYFPYPDGRAPAGNSGDMGFSGLRIRQPINSPDVWDEVLVFQGASYFRAIARDTLYGLSARGLAIGTGGAEPEEFPAFRAFWIEEPEPQAISLRIYALLDGPSVAGAFAFTITPGAQTVIDIRSRLFPRVDIAEAGIAPLTSMYFFGPEGRAEIDDFRDAVHDSHGLAMLNGAGERLWRPLSNPPSVQTSAFLDINPRIFGLMQRFRDFEHYQDAEARYERRPSAWIEPMGDWGRGSVMLVEIPAADEFSDNIVAFWRPQRPLVKASEHAFDYRLVWGKALPADPSIARVVATRTGSSILDERERVFVIDFDLDTMVLGNLTPKLSTSAGEIRGLSISSLPSGNLARVAFHFLPSNAPMAEFRLSLSNGERTVSEVWLYRWVANP